MVFVNFIVKHAVWWSLMKNNRYNELIVTCFFTQNMVNSRNENFIAFIERFHQNGLFAQVECQR